MTDSDLTRYSRRATVRAKRLAIIEARIRALVRQYLRECGRA